MVRAAAEARQRCPHTRSAPRLRDWVWGHRCLTDLMHAEFKTILVFFYCDYWGNSPNIFDTLKEQIDIGIKHPGAKYLNFSSGAFGHPGGKIIYQKTSVKDISCVRKRKHKKKNVRKKMSRMFSICTHLVGLWYRIECCLVKRWLASCDSALHRIQESNTASGIPH